MNPRLLVLSDSNSFVEWIEGLERHHFVVSRLDSEAELLEYAGKCELVVIRLDSNQRCLPDVVVRLGKTGKTPLVVVQSREAWDLAAAARACGVHDYLREPVSCADVAAAVERCLADRGGKKPIAGGALLGGERMVGNSAGMHQVRGQIARIGSSECNVLITGETGTGKELAAELIHRNSGRRGGPLVCLNCAAIPESLLESELFGYERGAFTGAHSSRPGQLELANGGVLFLDEIGELSPHAQAKILRAIEGKEIQRLGRQAGVKVDVRMVCATNRDLREDVRQGSFRADLLFRLNVAQLRMPPLRERKEDLPELAEFYFQDLNGRMGLRVENFTEHSWKSILHYDWPGNVREFKNVIEASLVQMPFPRMRLVELPAEFHGQFAPVAGEPSESERLLAALVCHNWNRSKAAQQMRWSRMTLYRKMMKYQLAPKPKARAQTA